MFGDSGAWLERQRRPGMPDKDGRTLSVGDLVRHWMAGFDDPVPATVLRVLEDDRYVIRVDREAAAREEMDIEEPTTVDGSTLEYLADDDG
jgi:hypothetical protein